MGIDLTGDMTNVLNNFAVVCTNRANDARQEAAAALVGLDQPPVNNDPTYCWQMRQKSNDLQAVAKVWLKRAATARGPSGNFLLSPSEHGDAIFLADFRDLIRTCKAAGRLLVTTDLDRALEPVFENPPQLAPGAPLTQAAAREEITFTSVSTKASPMHQGNLGRQLPGKGGSGLDSSGRPLS